MFMDLLAGTPLIALVFGLGSLVEADSEDCCRACDRRDEACLREPCGTNCKDSGARGDCLSAAVCELHFVLVLSPLGVMQVLPVSRGGTTLGTEHTGLCTVHPQHMQRVVCARKAAQPMVDALLHMKNTLHPSQWQVQVSAALEEH